MKAENSVKLLEELAANAWPSPRRIIYDGWVLGVAAEVVGRRVNSAVPLKLGHLPIEEKIDYVENFYHGLGRGSVFKATKASQPSALDGLLEDRGYKVEAPTSVMTIDMTKCPWTLDDDLSVANDFSENWMSIFADILELSNEKAIKRSEVLTHRLVQAGYAILELDGQAAACAQVGLERGHAGIFDVAVHPDFRRQGLGERMVRSVAAWAKAHKTNTVYLQVERHNQPAMALYSKMGFEEQYYYWYRVKSLN